MSVTAFARVSTDALTTEMAVNPLGVENPAPRLSWKIITDRNKIGRAHV